MPPDEVVDVAQNAKHGQELPVLADSKLPRDQEEPTDVGDAGDPD